MSDVVLVLGMHRSGTSAVSGTLTKLGGGAPKHLMPAAPGNARGHFESIALANFHDELLESAGSHWRDWRSFNPGWRRSPTAADFRRRAKELFAEEFNGSPLPVLKDPRICRFAPFWLDVLRDMQATPHIVMPIRSPLDVARSLSDRDGLSLTHGLLLWLRHVLDAEAESRREARSIFAWRDFRADWRGVCDKIADDTHLSWPRLSDRAARDIERFLTEELVHHDSDHAALVAHADVHEWTLRAYEALLELARNPLSNSALATLDDIRGLLDQSSKIFGRLLIDYEVDLEDVRGHAQALSHERDALHARQSEILAEKAAALAEFAARAEGAERAREEAARERQALAHDLSAVVAERAALRGAIEAERQARQHELGEKAAALAELAARGEQAERTRGELTREKEALAQDLAAAIAEREALHQAHAGIAAELQAQRREFAQQAAALAEFAELAAAAEQALEVAAREKEALSQSLAAAVAEREAQNASAEMLTKELQARRRELAEQAARAERAEMSRDDVAQAKEAVSRSLKASFAERDALDAASARVVAESQARRQELEEKAAALAELAARADAAEAARDGAAREREGLAVRVDQLSQELQRARELAGDRAAAREAAQAKALAAAESAHAAQIHALRRELVDAEAGLAHARATRARNGAGAWLAPANASRRWHARRLLRSGLFDAEFYRAQYAAGLPDPALKRDLAAARHYVEEGFCRGYLPNPLFDTRWYLERFEDVRRSGVNPLLHYVLHGWREGRDPGPAFHTDYYLDANPDVRASGANPLAHYLSHGRHEGRLAARPA